MNKGLSKVIDITRSLKESPTMSVGDGGFTNSATASGPVSGYDVPLPLPDLSQDYQTPGESGLARYRFSNVYPVSLSALQYTNDQSDTQYMSATATFQYQLFKFESL